MKILFLFIFLTQFNLSLTLDCEGVLYRTILRGHYKDVVSEENGGLLKNAKDIYFYDDNEDTFNSETERKSKSPLRNRIYCRYPGHARCTKPTPMIFQLQQTYEINTITIRFWDFDSRIHNFTAYIQQNDSSNEVKIHEGYAKGLITIKFSDQLVQRIRIETLGNSLDLNMSIIKIQAFYAFRRSVI